MLKHSLSVNGAKLWRLRQGDLFVRLAEGQGETDSHRGDDCQSAIIAKNKKKNTVSQGANYMLASWVILITQVMVLSADSEYFFMHHPNALTD